ncbi:MAG: hypothetical protein V4539_23005 [Bacteroidota bacterium]
MSGFPILDLVMGIIFMYLFSPEYYPQFDSGNGDDRIQTSWKNVERMVKSWNQAAIPDLLKIFVCPIS